MPPPPPVVITNLGDNPLPGTAKPGSITWINKEDRMKVPSPEIDLAAFQAYVKRTIWETCGIPKEMLMSQDHCKGEQTKLEKLVDAAPQTVSPAEAAERALLAKIEQAWSPLHPAHEIGTKTSTTLNGPELANFLATRRPPTPKTFVEPECWVALNAEDGNRPLFVRAQEPEDKYAPFIRFRHVPARTLIVRGMDRRVTEWWGFIGRAPHQILKDRRINIRDRRKC